MSKSRKIDLNELCPYPYEAIVGREEELMDAVTALYALRGGMKRCHFMRLMAACVARLVYDGLEGPPGATALFTRLLVEELDRPSLPNLEINGDPA